MVSVRPNGFIEPCIPTRAAEPPAGPDWVHEIKHDGYRLQVRRDAVRQARFTIGVPATRRSPPRRPLRLAPSIQMRKRPAACIKLHAMSHF
jgi:hypothetical protein